MFSTIDEAHRAELADDLRRLADFLETGPAVPVSPYGGLDLVYFPAGDDTDQAEQVDAVADLLGTEPHYEGAHYVCEKAFGRASYRVVAIPEHVRARHRALMTYQSAVEPD
ncbi:hypothetical protein [Nocardiopsis chromatogenes]|uniref:hypothetical protein n=1 Tax=Nocardiopsis chromatogenes TaxID=280239 RepID=UPI00034B21CB|nr:hypothetical protein [Nocardiopsis chromatogenes]